MRLRTFNRHCGFSTVSAHKVRPLNFDREQCFRSLVAHESSRINLFYDCANGDWQKHFTFKKEYSDKLSSGKFVNCGTEAGAFRALIEHICKGDYKDDDIIYVVEDDYMHRKGWEDALRDAFSQTGADYCTLYDHPDKYRDYPNLTSRIFTGRLCHWRETPSTTNTFAARFKTLREDSEIFHEFSTGVDITRDHHRFLALKERKNRLLLSSIPAYSTHMEISNMSPLWANHTAR